MRINQIELYNFGSYKGSNIFNFDSSNPNKRVVIIGGKNGAGKTTLFTAVQVCLYGNYTFGYKVAGKRYLGDINNLINNQIKLNESERAYIEIQFQQVDNSDLIHYVVRRAWFWPQNELHEILTVYRNGKELNQDELINFQSYLIHLIPPDMLKLYFFDGERIADYFCGDNEANIRDALMVLSGNDTFDILHDQVRRVLKASESEQSDVAHEYLSVQADIREQRRQLTEINRQLEDYQVSIESLETEIERHKKDYEKRGGITIDKWTELNNQLKTEDERRERLNWQRKSYATDLLPFVMLPDLFSRILPQIKAEKDYQTYGALKSTLEEPLFSAMLSRAITSLGNEEVESDTKELYNQIKGYLLDSRWDEFIPLFGLSGDEEGQVQSIISRVNSFDASTFRKFQRRITSSVQKSKEIRNKIQSTSIENFEEYLFTLSALEEELKLKILKKEHTQEILTLKELELSKKESNFRTLKKSFEEQLKSQSVSSISGKVLMLLEELQDNLYEDLLSQVQEDMNAEFNKLIRKKDYFSRILIDRNFSVHIIRDEKINCVDLNSLFTSGNSSVAKTVLGDTAVKRLQEILDADTANEMHTKLGKMTEEEILLPIEISKDSLSSGEKQIFTMALYWAMMNQSKNELPYIIDTPFARTDSEHRANITEFFFKKLTGQLIIFSTDEELSSHHLETMHDQISKVYMLEYGEDKATHICDNRYFEV